MKTFYSSRVYATALCILLSVVLPSTLPAQENPAPSELKGLTSAIPGQYIVVYKKNTLVVQKNKSITGTPQRQKYFRDEVTTLLRSSGIPEGKLLHTYETVLQGFAVNGLTGAELEKLRSNPQIDYIEADKMVQTTVMPGNYRGAAALSSPNCLNPNISINGVRNFSVGIAQFGGTATVTGPLELASPANGCTPLTSPMTGKIALIDREICEYSFKALKAQEAGAIGVIIVNNTAGGPIGMGAGVNGHLVTIPVLSISQADGQAIKNTLTGGTPITASIDLGLPNSTFQCTPWGISRVKGGLSGAGKRAWIVDTGIDMDHPDLHVNTGLSASFVAGNNSPEDDNGHGTHVAGTVAAKDNSEGVVGVAAGAEVVSVKVLNSAGQGAGSWIIAGLNYVAGSPDLSPNDVVNMSIGGDPSLAWDAALTGLAAHCKVAVSAGNDLRNLNFKSASRVIHPNVYAASAMDVNDNFASFSNYGFAVRYAAPGVDVISCSLNGGYAYLSGTSMASPHLAGMLLLGTTTCSGQRVKNDPDGMPDPILTLHDASLEVDSDSDGYTICDGDPDDTDLTVYPGAPEACDGKDNDGDGIIDEGCCPAGSPAILYVNAGATGANNGLSWSDAFTTLQPALAAASKCPGITRIWVAKGTYYPVADEFGMTAPTDARNKTFVLRNNLVVAGGFAGNEPESFDLSRRNFSTNKVTLSGDVQKDLIRTNDVYNVVRNAPPFGQTMDQTAVLDGFTLTGGNANLLTPTSVLVFPFGYAGGMMNFNADPEIRNCVFEANFGYFGAGMANSISAPTVKNSQFIRNLSGGFGSGIGNILASPVIVNSSFQLNTTEFDGAAVSNYDGSSPLILNATISGNRNTQGGAAIYNTNASSPDIVNTIVWGNTAGIDNEPAAAGILPSNPNIDYSIIQGLNTGARTAANLNTDPMFVSQPVPGSNTPGDLTLRPCSPALNAGDPSVTSAETGTADLGGAPRFFGSNVDIGAYEVQRAPFAVTISADPGLAIASGQSVELTAAGASSYTWSTAQLTESITVSPTATTTYSVTGVDAGCSGDASATITVGTLPVTLVSYHVKALPAGTVKTDWSTTEEIRNAYFEIERSPDLERVEKIAKIAPLGAGNGQGRNYAYLDEAPYQGRSYYRLVQVDLDGARTVYDWKMVTLGKDYAVYPNPVLSNRFSIPLDDPDRAVVNLYSLDGRKIKADVSAKKKGAVELSISSEIPAGVYTLKVEERGHTSSYQIVIGR